MLAVGIVIVTKLPKQRTRRLIHGIIPKCVNNIEKVISPGNHVIQL